MSAVSGRVSAEVLGSVDRWDATARLEMGGVSHAVAVRDGHESTFALAEDILRASAEPHAEAARRDSRAGLLASLHRVLLMTAGAAICLCALPGNASNIVMLVVGASGWVGGQVVSAATWTSLGHGGRPAAASTAIRVGGATLAVAGLAALATGFVHLLVWAAWGAAAAVLSILAPPRRATALAAGLALSVLVARLALGPAGGLVAACAAVTATLLAAAAQLRAERGPSRLTARGPVGRAAFLAIVQTAAQVGVLFWCLELLGPVAFASVALSGLVAGIGTDPLLEAGHVRVHHIADHPLTWRRGRTHMSLTGVSVALVVVGVAVATALTAAWAFGLTTELGAVAAGAALTAALAAATGLLLRTDAAGAAAALAAVTEVVCATATRSGLGTASPHLLLGVIAVVMTAIAAWITASRLAHPSAW